MELKAKTALVTGGAVRIGRAICEALAERGCNVIVHYNRSSAEARTLCRRLEGMGVAAFTVRADLASPAECEAMMAAALAKTGRLDVLVNNAAVFHKDTLSTLTRKKLMAELEVNLVAPIVLTRAFLTIHSRSRRGGISGKIVNLLDRRIVGSDPSCVPYVLSKKMLAEFTRTAALELAPAITVNGVAPGAILPPTGKGLKRVRELAGASPLKRQCTPADVAQAVVFLLESDAITGQTLFVDGGQHLLA